MGSTFKVVRRQDAAICPRRWNLTIVRVAGRKRSRHTAQCTARAVRYAAGAIDRQREHIICRCVLGNEEDRIFRPSRDAVGQDFVC